MEDKNQGGTVDETFLLDLAGKITKEWLDIGRYLMIPEADLHHLREDNRASQKETIYQMLLSWKQRQGLAATRQALAHALQKAHRKDLADSLGIPAKEINNSSVQRPAFVANVTKPVAHNPKHGLLQTFVNQPGRHNLVLGYKQSSDVILSCQHIRKHGNVTTLFKKQTHDFVYSKKGAETITAVLVKDNWDDNTGGNAEVMHGGPGQNSVKVRVTSQMGRGMDFTFSVYGKKRLA